MAPETPHLVSAILNAAYMVRHYARGGRMRIERDKRQKAIHAMGMVVRDAFNSSEDFEALLAAVVDGLSPKDVQPF
jgi:hypothetical protein